MTPIRLHQTRFDLALSEVKTLDLYGAFLTVAEALGPFDVALDGLGEVRLDQGYSFRAPHGQFFRKLVITNRHSLANVVRLFYGVGDIYVPTTVPVPLAIASSWYNDADITLNNAVITPILGSDTTLRDIVIQANNSNTVNIRVAVAGAAAAATGIELAPGERLHLPSAPSGISCYAPAAGQKISSMGSYK